MHRQTNELDLLRGALAHLQESIDAEQAAVFNGSLVNSARLEKQADHIKKMIRNIGLAQELNIETSEASRS